MPMLHLGIRYLEEETVGGVVPSEAVVGKDVAVCAIGPLKADALCRVLWQTRHHELWQTPIAWVQGPSTCALYSEASIKLY